MCTHVRTYIHTYVCMPSLYAYSRTDQYILYSMCSTSCIVCMYDVYILVRTYVTCVLHVCMYHVYLILRVNHERPSSSSGHQNSVLSGDLWDKPTQLTTPWIIGLYTDTSKWGTVCELLRCTVTVQISKL